MTAATSGVVKPWTRPGSLRTRSPTLPRAPVPARGSVQGVLRGGRERELERISHYKVIKASQPYIGKEPAIPVTYLSSIPEGYDVNDYGISEYDKILPLQEGYVERFSPGRYVRVDAPHLMEVAIPKRITEELLRSSLRPATSGGGAVNLVHVRSSSWERGSDLRRRAPRQGGFATGSTLRAIGPSSN